MSIKNKLTTLTLLAALFLVSSCVDDDDGTTPSCISGEGVVTTRTLSVADFTGIDQAITSNVTISQGTPQKVEATGHPNIIDIVSTTVSNGIWGINLQGNCTQDFELSFAITVPNINQLILSGTGSIIVNNFANQDGLTVDLSGSGDITLNEFEGPTNIDATLTGSGNIIGNNDISTLDNLTLTNSGSGNYLGFPISSNDCTINSTGTGDCEISVQNTLNVTISGTGDVSYKGNPTITQNVTGTGSLIDAN